MNRNKTRILCTAHIDETLKEKAEDSGIDMDVIPFVQTNPIINETLAQDIKGMLMQDLDVVFTSIRAVEAIAADTDELIKNNWRIYCIGNATRNAVALHFGENAVKGIADNAATLADVIIQTGNVKQVTFFCGDIRRQELPDELRKQNIGVNEIIVYQTIAVGLKIDKDYDGILFFSPSAVNSFFAGNSIKPNVVLFAIGDTTATAIKGLTNNEIIVSGKPGKEKVIDKVVAYFNKRLIHK